jgi:NAD(P)H-hydrate epimerase
MAALRSGAGLVTVATPRSSAPVVASLGAEFMTLGLEEAEDGTVSAASLDELLAFDADVLAVGPGLGRSMSAVALARGLVERSTAPLILDADGINAFAGAADQLQGREGTPIVITPHAGEMARLTGMSADEVQAHRIDVAREFASSHRVHVVLKGHRTVIAAPDGKAWINMTGNAGMATAGTGDVLTGVIAGWFGQLLDADAAVRLGVYLHGAAGDLAAVDQGEVALVAGDIVDELSEAVLELTARRRPAPADPP